MAVRRDVRRRANTYFFGKVLANALLLVIGVILISTFLRRVQESTAISRQLHNSEQSLAEAFSILEKNEEGAKELTRVFHDGKAGCSVPLSILTMMPRRRFSPISLTVREWSISL